MALVITLEICKLIQTLFIDQDAELCSTEREAESKCLTFTLHEDLGIVSHVFADKTGTLTANRLTPMGISVGGDVFRFYEN